MQIISSVSFVVRFQLHPQFGFMNQSLFRITASSIEQWWWWWWWPGRDVESCKPTLLLYLFLKGKKNNSFFPSPCRGGLLGVSLPRCYDSYISGQPPWTRELCSVRPCPPSYISEYPKGWGLVVLLFRLVLSGCLLLNRRGREEASWDVITIATFCDLMYKAMYVLTRVWKKTNQPTPPRCPYFPPSCPSFSADHSTASQNIHTSST